MANITVSSPFLQNTENDRTALVIIVTIVCFTLTLMTLTAKNCLRPKLAVTWKSFDIILHFGVLLLGIQFVLIIIATKSGLGKHVSDNTTLQNGLILKVRSQYSLNF